MPAAIGAAMLIGCASQPEGGDSERLDELAEQSAGVFDIALDSEFGTAGGGRPEEASGWSVVVATVPSGRMEDAERLLESVQTGAGLENAYITLRNGRPVVAFGSYDDPTDQTAQDGLARVRRSEVGGVNPFATAFLAPPTARVSAGSDDAHDLRLVKGREGERAVYTLQIGAYGRTDRQRPTQDELALFRREAERAVATLRSEGEDAFYYHGPNMSMVTIGVFSESDHDATTTPPIESRALRDLRKRFPTNLLNGEGLMETIRTDQGPKRRLQSSRLVAIPKK